MVRHPRVWELPARAGGASTMGAVHRNGLAGSNGWLPVQQPWLVMLLRARLPVPKRAQGHRRGVLRVRLNLDPRVSTASRQRAKVGFAALTQPSTRVAAWRVPGARSGQYAWPLCPVHRVPWLLSW